jgi:hypothetical protein
MGADLPHDPKAFDEFLVYAAPIIGDEVTSLLRKGRPLSCIAGMFERAPNGRLLCIVGERVDLSRRVLCDRRLSPASLGLLLDGLRSAGSDELPILLLIDNGRQVWTAVRWIRRRSRAPRGSS